MTLMRKLLTLLILLLPFVLSAQTSLAPVELVLDNGKVRNGFINEKDWQPFTGRFIFKPAKDSAIFIGVDSVNELTIGEEPELQRYFGYKGPVFQHRDESGAIPRALNEIKIKTDTLLLEAVVLGTVNLFAYQPEEGDAHFFIQKGEEIEELSTYRYIGPTARQQITRSVEYRTQLRTALNDCYGLEEWVGVVRPDEVDLRKLIIAYNECEENALVYVNTPPKRRMVLSGLAGISFTRVSRNQDQLIGLSSGRLMPRFGAGFKIYNRDYPDTKAWVAELLYSPIQTIDKEGEIEVEMTYLQLNAIYQRSWPSGASWPYVLAGLRYGYQLNNKLDVGLPPRVLEEHTVGLLVGFGVQRGRFRMGLRYEIDNLALFFPQAPNYYANTLSLLAGFDLITNR